MVDVAVEGDHAVFRIEGLDKLWSLRSRLEIPLAHISAVEVNHETEIPGLLAAGAFYYQSELVFWDVHDPGKTIIVSLDHEHYKKLIVEVADPVATAGLLREVIGQRR